MRNLSIRINKKTEYNLLKSLIKHFNLLLTLFSNWDQVCWHSEVGCWEPLRFSGELHVPYVQHYSTLAHTGYYRGEPLNHSTLMSWQRARLQRTFTLSSCVRNRKVVGVTAKDRHRQGWKKQIWQKWGRFNGAEKQSINISVLLFLHYAWHTLI